jgi:hypothetical protein
MPPREPQPTPPKTFAINSSRDMLEKLRREIERLAHSIIRQEVVDHGLNAAMTAWHLTDWTGKEIKDIQHLYPQPLPSTHAHTRFVIWKRLISPRLRSLATRAGAPIRELKQFQEFVKRDCTDLAYCEGIAVSTKRFGFSKVPVESLARLRSRSCVGLHGKAHKLDAASIICQRHHPRYARS